MFKAKNDICWNISLFLCVIGALNWGFIGSAGINLVERLFGFSPLATNLIYISVGIASLYIIYRTVFDLISED